MSIPIISEFIEYILENSLTLPNPNNKYVGQIINPFVKQYNINLFILYLQEIS